MGAKKEEASASVEKNQQAAETSSDANSQESNEGMNPEHPESTTDAAGAQHEGDKTHDNSSSCRSEPIQGDSSSPSNGKDSKHSKKNKTAPKSESESDEEEYLDLTEEDAQESEKRPVANGIYDPRPVEDGARRTIAYLLIGLLWAIIGAILIMIAWNSVEIKDLKEFGVLLSPITVLVSAATGFYYGTKSKN